MASRQIALDVVLALRTNSHDLGDGLGLLSRNGHRTSIEVESDLSGIIDLLLDPACQYGLSHVVVMEYIGCQFDGLGRMDTCSRIEREGGLLSVCVVFANSSHLPKPNDALATMTMNASPAFPSWTL